MILRKLSGKWQIENYRIFVKSMMYPPAENKFFFNSHVVLVLREKNSAIVGGIPANRIGYLLAGIPNRLSSIIAALASRLFA